MLIFDAKGNLKPYTPIPCDVKELKAYLVDAIPSDTRITNFEKYVRYSDQLKTLIGGTKMRQWINGSFVTRKKNPQDIDLVTFIDYKTIERLGNKLNDFKAGGSWTAYEVDAYLIPVYPSQNALFKYSELDIAEWLDLFSHSKLDRNGRRFEKGFLEIFY